MLSYDMVLIIIESLLGIENGLLLHKMLVSFNYLSISTHKSQMAFLNFFFTNDLISCTTHPNRYSSNKIYSFNVTES